MFHDGWQRHGEWFRQFADGDVVASLQFRQQRAPRRIGDGGENTVQMIVRIVNHMVKYRDVADHVKTRLPLEPRSIDVSDYCPEAALMSLIASSLAHSAGPAIVAISQPAPSTRTEVGMPSARPTAFNS